MPVAATSRAAFDTVQLGERQAEVLDAIKALWAPVRVGTGPSDQEIAAYLGWTINRVTPRRGELEELGLVVRGGLKTGETGRKVSWWRPVARWEQLTLFGEER